MPSVRDIRRRIRSVENTGKVTNAMSLVAASKMRRAQMAVTQGRPYSEKMLQVITNLAAQPINDSGSVHPLLESRPVNNVGLLLIEPDRGLAGGLHSSINGSVGRFMGSLESNVSTICVGRKGREFLNRSGSHIVEFFTDLGDRPTLSETEQISSLVIQEYSNGNMDELYVAYAKFESTMSQKPVVEKLLPVEPAELTSAALSGYTYEPAPASLIDTLLPKFIAVQVYQAILESIASEQSARMVAMRSATDNAKSLGEELTLTMNKLRQDSITNELLDLVGGQMALEG